MLSDLNIIICVMLEVPFVELKEFFVLQKPCFLLVMNHFICRVKRILRPMQDFFSPNTEPSVKI